MTICARRNIHVNITKLTKWKTISQVFIQCGSCLKKNDSLKLFWYIWKGVTSSRARRVIRNVEIHEDEEAANWRVVVASEWIEFFLAGRGIYQRRHSET